jgi:hypothetical protein
VPATSSFTVTLPPHAFAGAVLPDSPFGINMALGPDTPDLHHRRPTSTLKVRKLLVTNPHIALR